MEWLNSIESVDWKVLIVSGGLKLVAALLVLLIGLPQ